jgi:transposase
MRKERTFYSKEFKIKAVELSIQRGSVIVVAKELNIRPASLARWKEVYKAGKYATGGASGVKSKIPEETELVRLKKELYDIKLERDILKKAVGIFSKNDR